MASLYDIWIWKFKLNQEKCKLECSGGIPVYVDAKQDKIFEKGFSFIVEKYKTKLQHLYDVSLLWDSLSHVMIFNNVEHCWFLYKDASYSDNVTSPLYISSTLLGRNFK